ncbi:MAG: YraN family protein [Eubacteriales bacterium]|nr:YraN family protein [Eubacteriales bacterium]
MDISNKRAVGNKYEDIAVRNLKQSGYVILTRNYYTRYGEIDIIGRDGDVLCFIEVKYRKSSRYGMPYEAVDSRKQRKIIRTSEEFIYKNEDKLIELFHEFPQIRFDIVEILNNKIRIIKNAFYK